MQQTKRTCRFHRCVSSDSHGMSFNPANFWNGMIIYVVHGLMDAALKQKVIECAHTSSTLIPRHVLCSGVQSERQRNSTKQTSWTMTSNVILSPFQTSGLCANASKRSQKIPTCPDGLQLLWNQFLRGVFGRKVWG
eukprot:2023397-Amphidinium_carterae.1